MPKIQNSKNYNLRNLKILLAFFGLLSLSLWTYLRFGSPSNPTTVGNYFALSLSVTPFIAGLYGFGIAKSWGGLKSLLGKAITSLSIGLVLWSMGNFTWAYYNIIKNVPAPYPSLADVGYGLGVLFWILSTIYLGRALGAGVLARKNPKLKWVAITLAALSIGLSYYLFVTVARGGDLGLQSSQLIKAGFDVYYPLTDVVSLIVITSVFIVSARYVGGLLRRPSFMILLGVLASYIYDLSFSYSTTKNTYSNGQFSDIFLLAATVSLSVAIYMFGNRAVKLNGAPK